MIFLETDRLRLRNVAVKDADIMFDCRGNEICARYQRSQNKDNHGNWADLYFCGLLEDDWRDENGNTRNQTACADSD